MGDSRHKNSPLPSDEEDDVSDDLIKDARARLDENKRLNKISGAVEGDANYLIDSQAALAREVAKLVGKDDVSDKHISNILGPVREKSKWDRVERSTYVRPIRVALKLEETIKIEVPVSRATLLNWLARLTPENFAKYEAAFEQARTGKK